MSLGYVAQSVIHRQRPEVLTEIGAVLMLLAVSLIAAARWCQSRTVAASGLETFLLPEGRKGVDDEMPDAKAGSLASFVAAEFSGLALPSIRQRRVLATAAADALHVTLA